MAAWTCPLCDRSFGRRNQSHVCEPAMPVDLWFEDRPAEWRAIYDAVVGHLEQLGPIVVDAVEVGLLIKRARTFAELRPRKKDKLALSVLLSERLDHPRIYKKLSASGHRVAHFVELASAKDVDRQVRAWLRQGFDESPL